MAAPADPILSAYRRVAQAGSAQLGAPESLACGQAYCIPAFAGLPDANQVRDVLLLQQTFEAAYDEVEAFFARQGRRCLRWSLSSEQAVEPVAAGLATRGWQRSDAVVLGHRTWPPIEALRPGGASNLRILPARAMRAALRLTFAEESGSASADAADERMNDSELDLFVALLDGAPAGRIALHQVGDILHVRDAWVLPARRGQGVGRAMLRHVMSLAYRLRPRVIVASGPRSSQAGAGLSGAAGRLAEEFGFAESGRIPEWDRLAP